MGISFELMVLAAASLWGFLQLVAAAQAANAQHGPKWVASPRDVEMPPLAPISGRINRNFRLHGDVSILCRGGSHCTGGRRSQ
jgi:uncharacterized MAPEG superfamily protein